MAEITADATEAKTAERGENWEPATPIPTPPVFVWPIQPAGLFKFFFSIPGYFAPWNALYMGIAILAWLFFTPEMSRMTSFEFGWIAEIYARNIVILLLVFGGLHFRFYIQRAQGTKFKINQNWPRVKSEKFLFGDQIWDNMFWSLVSGGAIWTAYEVVTLWAFANGHIAMLSFEAHPVYFVLLFCAIPLIRDAHFYFVHRLLHAKLMYKPFHELHHRNINIGPWSGLSMHPVEHVLYFSGILLHWVLLSHPLHAVFHVVQTGISPAIGHCGYDRLLVGGKEIRLGQRLFHFLHHRFFECNYGGDGAVPLDKAFGSMHDGTREAAKQIRARKARMHGEV